MRLARLRIQLVDVAGLLKHHCARACVESLDVEVGELGHLRQLLGFRFVRPDILDAIAIRDEVDGVADPRRIDVLRVGPRRRNEIKSFEIDNPDRPVLPAPVVAPLVVPGVVHAISKPCAIRRVLALEPARQRQRDFHSAFGGNRPEARRGTRRFAGARGREQHRLAVGRPTLHQVRTRMPRQAFRLAAFGRDDIDVDVARVVATESQPLTVGREVRIGRLSLEAGDAASGSTSTVDGPDVVRVGERDLLGADRRRAQQPRRSHRHRLDAG